MQISRQYKQLVKVAGGINLLFLLLCILFMMFLRNDGGEYEATMKKVVRFMLANSICWILNLALLLLVVPAARARKIRRWQSFYLPSFMIAMALAVVIYFRFQTTLSYKPPEWDISGPISFVITINTLSLVVIELILSRYASYDIHLENITIKMENAELKMKSLQAQHEKLKHQLHPHFLFNSLSVLKSLIHKDRQLAETYLVKLSEFLRFSISHNEQNTVRLEEELRFCLYYLEMQQVRFGQALQYSIEIPAEQSQHAHIPVFSLQLAIENAIKHNRLTVEAPLSIILRYMPGDWLLVENNVHEKNVMGLSGGIGLKNLSDRYRLMSQEDIRILHEEGFFRLYLKIIRE